MCESINASDKDNQKQIIDALVMETDKRIKELEEELYMFENRLSVLKDIQGDLSIMTF